MKALSVFPQYAALIASGAKVIEGRRWKTSYRGPLAIYASRSWGQIGFRGVQEWLLSEDCPASFWHALSEAHVDGQARYCGSQIARHDYRESDFVDRDAFTCGAIIAVAQLHVIVPTADLEPVTYHEQAPYCDFDQMTHAWVLRDVRRLAPAVTVPTRDASGKTRNFQGLWNVPADVEGLLA